MRPDASSLPDAPARLHLVGVAGSGMQPLAVLLAEAGYRVSGSDRADGPRLEALRSCGVDARAGHHPDLAAEAALVIVSPSIPADDPELRAVRRANLPILHRADALSLLAAGRETICVSGSHGKTTTTALLAHILAVAGRDPGFMVGGTAARLGGRSGRLGRRDAPFVMEACEAFGALAAWHPAHLLLTCIDDEHNEDYGGQEGLMLAFSAYVGRLPASGMIVGCGDDTGVSALLATTARPVLTYGLGPGNRLRAVPDDATNSAAIWLDEKLLGILAVPLAGRHMLLNILGAVGMALSKGVAWPDITDGVASFTGVDRRMQPVGSVAGIRVFDDFAHHPAEVAATLHAAHALAPRDGRVVVVLEAQRPHRMERLAGRFAQALQAADLVLLMAVDGDCLARGNTGQRRLAEALSDQGIAFRSLDSVADLAAMPWRAEDTVVVMAHGSSSALAEAVLSALPTQQLPRDALSVLHGPGTPAEIEASSGAEITLLDLFERQLERNAAALGAEDAEATLTYADLAARSAAVAAMLHSAGIRRGEMVAVCLGRGVARAVAFLGVLRAGAVYLPLDPDLPVARLAMMAEDAQTRFALTDPTTRPLIEGMGLTCHDVTALSPTGQACDLPSVRPIHPDEPAYLIYTSGSTGEPKGALIPHGALAQYAQAAADRFGVHGLARIAPLTSFGFDISIGDMAMALTRGAAVVFPSATQARIGPPLARFLVAARVTHITHTPSALLLVPPLPEGAALTHVISMGEPCPPDLVARWAPGRCLINAYGPTEATILSTSAICEPGRAIHVGTPFPGEGVCILDDRLMPVPAGEQGEICILGAGLALRYHRRPFLTEDRYPTVDLGPHGRHRVYRTGDLGRLSEDGTLICEGRLDDQIKFRGFRVEPAEIEAALRRQAGVDDAYVRLHRAGGRPDMLVAYVVGPTAATLAGRAILTSALARRLPPHMVPAAIVPVPDIPINANGKRIASAMPPPPEPDAHPAATLDEPFTPTQYRLVALYRDVLGLTRPIGTRETLASLGVDSLQTATLYLAIEEAFGVILTLDLGRDAETIELLALHLDALAAEAGPRGMTPTSARSDTVDALVQSQRGYLAGWKGRRVGPRGLLACLAEPGASDAPPLFWCFQGSAEHQELALQLGATQPVIAMRSGNLIMEYTDENLAALAACYADEVMAAQSTGALRLGGNCQGGLVMHRVALELISRGRDVALLILMEVGQFPAYPGRVALLFGSDSHFNPYLSMANPKRVFDLAYAGGYEVGMVPGMHGKFFRPPLSAPLARRIAGLLGANLPLQADEIVA